MNLDQPISQAAFAELVGLSEASVSDWLRQGHLQRGAPGRAWVQAYCTRLREQAAGRDPTGELTSERARLAREQADRLAMENAERRGRLIPADRVEPRLRELFVGLREKLLGWSRELPPLLVGRTEREMQAELDRQTRAALTRLASWRLGQPDDDDDDEPAPAAGSSSDASEG